MSRNKSKNYDQAARPEQAEMKQILHPPGRVQDDGKAQAAVEEKLLAMIAPAAAYCSACGVAIGRVGGQPGQPVHLMHPKFGNCRHEGKEFKLPQMELLELKCR